MSKYVNLINVKTNYAMRMNRLSNRIFGEVVRDVPQSSMKVIKLFSEKPVQKRSEIVEYYPRLRATHLIMKNLRFYGLFRNEHQDFKEEQQRMKILRGKQPWVRGQKKDKN